MHIDTSHVFVVDQVQNYSTFFANESDFLTVRIFLNHCFCHNYSYVVLHITEQSTTHISYEHWGQDGNAHALFSECMHGVCKVYIIYIQFFSFNRPIILARFTPTMPGFY